MFIRQARKNEEVWLLDHLDGQSLDDQAFRSREYIFLFEDDGERPIAFARGRIHRDTENPNWGEFTSFDTNTDKSLPQVLPRLISGLDKRVRDEGLDDENTIFIFTENPQLFTRFGFEPVDRENLKPMVRDRLEKKESYLYVELDVLMLKLGELNIESFDATDEEEVPDIGDIEEEKEALGFSDDDDMTYKYST